MSKRRNRGHHNHGRSLIEQVREKIWVIRDHWSVQDNASAKCQGWYIVIPQRRVPVTPWVNRTIFDPPRIVFVSPKGEATFERYVKNNRRLAMRALQAITIANLEH